jgi:hypothetical protein
MGRPLHRDAPVVAVVEADRGSDGWGMFYARGENFRHVRHAQILSRWPVIAEAWAVEMETARIASVDRTPGAATFGR